MKNLKSSIGGLLCELDIKKACDHVNWDFLFCGLHKMGFVEKQIGWIKWCITTISYFVFISDSTSGFFHNSRGLRKGDSLSPY